MSSTPARPIPPVPTELSPELEAAANQEYETWLDAELAEAEAEPSDGYTIEQVWEHLCERHPWLIG
jgi:hypothetical protein